MKHEENIQLCDSRNFHYEVHVRHSPHHGFSTAYYNGRVIAQCELGRILAPNSDDDREWETYEERFSEWRDEILLNLKMVAKKYFDEQHR